MSTTSDNHIMFSYSWKSGHEKVHDIARQFQAADIPIWMDIYNGLGPNLLDGMAEAVEGSAADTTQKCAVGRMDSPEEQSSSYNGFLPDIFSTQTGYRASQNLQSEYSTLHGYCSIQPLSDTTQKCAVGRMDSPEEQSSLYNGFLPDIFPTQTGYRASQNLQNINSTPRSNHF
ncbi:unnamed protein product [Rotaria sordida]|uniref:Uncharacterized protein n=1 Tax=Rotaria sordida TaxID=392033 RepID=A0A814THP3_9BILA|nr:unnamed protein product [Rotaria sordida]